MSPELHRNLSKERSKRRCDSRVAKQNCVFRTPEMSLVPSNATPPIPTPDRQNCNSRASSSASYMRGNRRRPARSRGGGSHRGAERGETQARPYEPHGCSANRWHVSSPIHPAKAAAHAIACPVRQHSANKEGAEDGHPPGFGAVHHTR
jgi:hypothetical protein